MRIARSLHLCASAIVAMLWGGARLCAGDLVIADFEEGNFQQWEVAGDAFGKAPASGPLGGQMPIGGFAGKGFASSFHGGDSATGTLTSPGFKVERRYINFLIGGGGFEGETCINLLQDGKVVRTAVGKNIHPGGSEQLEPYSWDVGDLAGQAVSLRIVDQRQGGWGHISIDRIVQSDKAAVADFTTRITINKRYLLWPVAAEGKDKQRFLMSLDGEEEPFAFSNIAISDQPDFWVFTDLANFQGRVLTLTARIPDRKSDACKMITLSDSYPGSDELYKEPLRPQYHFSSRRGWLNDPIGLVRQNGIWHLFYQHNPYGHGWDNMHWGHATSSDLLSWSEQPTALFPDGEGFMYSGSGFIVKSGKSSLPVEGDESIVLAYTAEGTRSYLPGRKTEQALALSKDGGKTFTKFSGNPVLPHIVGENRDPKVFWHEPTASWVMALYLDGEDYGIFTSPDLLKWTQTQTYRIPGESECPDLFPLAVDGKPDQIRWVAWGANGKYLVGDFDGRTFTHRDEVRRHYFGAAYAGQSYDNAPDQRRTHIGWMRNGTVFKGAPFNLQMTLPMDFTLRSEGKKIRLHAEPSREVDTLRTKTREFKDLEYKEGDENPLYGINDELFEIEAVIDADTQAREIGFKLFDEYRACWKPGDQTFTGAEGAQPPLDGKLRIRIFIDRLSMEVFINGTYIARYIRQSAGKTPIRLVAEGGPMRIDSLKVHALGSVWK